MNDVMIDLETLGTRPGCAVLSIGAVAFDPVTGELGATFHELISTASCRALGLREESATIAWWEKQPEAARRVLDEAARSEVFLPLALARFAAYIEQPDGGGGPDRVRIWGNGADFDNAILAHLYAVTGQFVPWKFWNGRCYRTLKNLHPLPELLREGVFHNALDDARHQAIHACRIFRAIRAEANAVRKEA